MNDAPTKSREASCGCALTSRDALTTGKGVELTGVMTAALCATTQKEQWEAGELCRARASCT